LTKTISGVHKDLFIFLTPMVINFIVMPFCTKVNTFLFVIIFVTMVTMLTKVTIDFVVTTVTLVINITNIPRLSLLLRFSKVSMFFD
jgi:hypothetical protein